jgi:hypothetical protein
MQLARDLLDQLLRDPEGEPAGRADDFTIVVGEDGIHVESILTGGGIVADDLGLVGRGCERLCRLVRRRPLRRTSIAWSAVSEVAEHALTVPHPGAAGRRTHRVGDGIRLRAIRRVPTRTADGVRLHLVDLQVVDPRPRQRLRVAGFIVRPRRRLAWPVSLRPRQRAASPDWKLVASSDVRLSAHELVLERTFESLAPARDRTAAPPKRRPRSRP